MTMIVMGMAVAVAAVLFAAVHARNASRPQTRFAALGELGAMPWINAGGEGSDCDGGTAGDAGCGDGGGGGD